METFRFLHVGDVHLSDRYQAELGPILDAVRDAAYKLRNDLDLIVFTGDLFHKPVMTGSYAARRLCEFFFELNGFGVPIVVVRGTPSHDGIGGLEFLKPFAIVVDAEPEKQMYWDMLPASGNAKDFVPHYHRESGVFFLERGNVRAAFLASMPRHRQEDVKARVRDCFRHVATPDLFFTHAMVSSAKTEHGVPTDLFDVEWTLEELKDLGVPLIGLGHVHKPQVLSTEPLIYYAGSVGRLHIGEAGDKSIVHGFSDGKSIVLEQIPMPASKTHYVKPDRYEDILSVFEHMTARDALLINNYRNLDLAPVYGELERRFGYQFLRNVRVEYPEEKRQTHVVERWRRASVEDLVVEHVVNENKDADVQYVRSRFREIASA
jgi:exonuclease SbcD